MAKRRHGKPARRKTTKKSAKKSAKKTNRWNGFVPSGLSLSRARGLGAIRLPLLACAERKTLVLGEQTRTRPQRFAELSEARYEARQLAMYNPNTVFHYHQERPGGKFQIEMAGLLAAK